MVEIHRSFYFPAHTIFKKIRTSYPQYEGGMKEKSSRINMKVIEDQIISTFSVIQQMFVSASSQTIL